LGLALVGLAPGGRTTVAVPAGRAYGPADPARVRRWRRARFPLDQPLPVGKWGRVLSQTGRSRPGRIRGGGHKGVPGDTNPRGAGQALELEVELVGIQARDAVPDLPGP